MPFMPKFRSGNSKANIDYEAFKIKYDTKSFKTDFKLKYDAAIKEIKSNKASNIPAPGRSPTKDLNYTSQQTLIEYYVNAKLADAELLTILVFDKLNEFAKTTQNTSHYNNIKTLHATTLGGDNHEVTERNQEMTGLIQTALDSPDTDLHENPDFIRLLVLLLTIRYYTYTIVDTIFQNGKNNIESIIKNITAMNNHATAIQTIVDTIVPPTLDAEGVSASGTSASGTTMNDTEQMSMTGEEPSFFNFSNFFGSASSSRGGQIGGVKDDVASILNTISSAQVANDPAISQLVKYSTNILCNALTLLSVSISFPIIESPPSLRAIMLELYNNMTKFFIDPLFAQENIAKVPDLKNLKNALIEVITEDDYKNIISNITTISNIPNTNNNITTVAPVVYNEPPEDTTTILNITAAQDSVRELIDQQLAGKNTLIPSAQEAGNIIITSYYNNGSDLSLDYITSIATAIVSVFLANKDSYSPKDIAYVCTIAAANSKHNTDYRDFVNKFTTFANGLLETKTKLQSAPVVRVTTGGGALPPNYNLQLQLQSSIIKGIERSKFFRLTNTSTEPEVVVAEKKGGQRTQKNRKRNMNRGGTRRNINSNNSNNSNNYNV